MKKLPIAPLLILLATAALAAGVPARAEGGAGRSQGASEGQADVVASDVGTGWNILQIPASAFEPENDGMRWRFDPFGYRSWDGGGEAALSTRFIAPVQLPSGAGIGFLNLYASDRGADNVFAFLRLYTGYGARPQCLSFPRPCAQQPVNFTDLLSVASIGSGGEQYVSSAQLSPLHTVNNNVVYQGGAQYAVYVYVPFGQYAFKAVDIWWKRQIAPAPAAARFTDVPLGAQFFAEVEALAASGITGGCTATQFCPEAPVTRRQMAAFLARALGLYFQY